VVAVILADEHVNMLSRGDLGFDLSRLQTKKAARLAPAAYPLT
jgi:hypothetical protein